MNKNKDKKARNKRDKDKYCNMTDEERQRKNIRKNIEKI